MVRRCTGRCRCPWSSRRPAGEPRWRDPFRRQRWTHRRRRSGNACRPSGRTEPAQRSQKIRKLLQPNMQKSTNPADNREEAEPNGGLHATSSDSQRWWGGWAPLRPQVQEGHEVHECPEGCDDGLPLVMCCQRNICIFGQNYLPEKPMSAMT